MAAPKQKITKAEFVKRFTELTVEHMSALPAAEQEKRLAAAERRLRANRRDVGPKASCIEEIAAIPLQGRSRHE
jgi:hypothetical protein